MNKQTTRPPTSKPKTRREVQSRKPKRVQSDVAYRERLRAMERDGDEQGLARELAAVKLTGDELGAIAKKCPPADQWQD